MKGSHFFEKRRKELAKQEKAKQKADRKAQRKAGKGLEGAEGTDIEGSGELEEVGGASAGDGASFGEGALEGNEPDGSEGRGSTGAESDASIASAPSPHRT